MIQKIRSYMMPIAIAIGILFYEQVSELAFLIPFLIGIMLFITYSGIQFSKIRFSKFHYILLAIQVLISPLIYFIIAPFNVVIAQSAMICVFMPTATAAPVITGMLGGNVESLTTYSLLCNVTIAILAPFYFSLMGNVDAGSMTDATLLIAQRVCILLLLPLLIAFVIKKMLPKVNDRIKKYNSLSFYLWVVSLIVITGKTVFFILNQENPDYSIEISIAIISLFICVGQFLIGRRIGKRYADSITGGQSLGQKNTVLGIWMAQSYLNPISSLGPGAYILWQNLINSYQVWKARDKN